MLAPSLYLIATADPLLSPKGWRPSALALKQSLRLPEALKDRFKRFLASPKFEKLAPGQLVPAVTAKEIVDKLSDPQLSPVAGASLDQLPSEEVQDLLLLAQDAVAAVRARLPVGLVESSTFKSATLVRSWKTLSDPMSLVDDLECGVLSREQVSLVADALPAVYDLMATALLEALIEHEAANPGKLVPYNKLKQAAVLLRQPLVNQDLKGLLAANFATEDKPTPTGGGVRAGGNPEALLTNLQKREFKE